MGGCAPGPWRRGAGGRAGAEPSPAQRRPRPRPPAPPLPGSGAPRARGRCCSRRMSWFNASQLSSFAKQALSQAQKSIDRVLDIQAEESPWPDAVIPDYSEGKRPAWPSPQPLPLFKAFFFPCLLRNSGDKISGK